MIAIPRRIASSLPILIAVLSFAIYAIAVLTLNQGQHARFFVEEEGPFPAALSHRLYGINPNGLIDLGLQDFFERAVNSGASAERTLDDAAAGRAVTTGNVALTRDGTGVGGIIMAEIAFALFGLSAQALPMFFLALVGLSTLVFILRYSDQRVLAVPTVLLALTLLLLTSVSIGAEAIGQAPIGGLRYYVVLGILPALHWCMEFLEDRSAPIGLLRWALLFIQAAILGFVILVRGSPAYLIGPVAVCAALALWRATARRHWQIALLLLLPAALVYTEVVALPGWSFPEYASAGRLYGTVWHRLFISLGENPAWPFPGVRRTYDCPGISEGIVAGVVDRNAHCVWEAYTRQHNISASKLLDELYGAQYEQVLRSAFFAIVQSYPREVFLTFFCYKPISLYRVMIDSTLRWRDAASLTVWLCLIQALLLSAFILVRPPPLREAGLGMGLLLLFTVFGILSQLVAWPTFYIALDVIVYQFCGYAIAVSLVVSVARRLLDRRR